MTLVYIKDDDPSWETCVTFEQWVCRMIDEKKTDSPGFQAFLNIPGKRDQITEIYLKHRAKKNET